MEENASKKNGNASVLSVTKLNKVLRQALESKDATVEVPFENPVSRIDIVFIAGLILHHEQHKTKFNLQAMQLEKDAKAPIARIYNPCCDQNKKAPCILNLFQYNRAFPT